MRNDYEDASPLSLQVAGLALLFLAGSVPFYWALVIAYENKMVDYLLCRRGSRVGADSKRGASKLQELIRD